MEKEVFLKHMQMSVAKFISRSSDVTLSINWLQILNDVLDVMILAVS